jgi:hypothetical protein
MDIHPTLDDFRILHGNVTKEKFLAKFRDPFLVIDLGALLPDGGDFRALSATSSERPTETRVRSAARNPRIEVAILAKTGRNSFGNMITLGRAKTNDVVVPHGSVSKFHAFFRKDFATGLMAVWDAGSKFGTRMNGTDLKTGEGTTVESGAALVLGRAIRATYFAPDEFYEYMHLMARLKTAGRAASSRPAPPPAP